MLGNPTESNGRNGNPRNPEEVLRNPMDSHGTRRNTGVEEPEPQERDKEERSVSRQSTDRVGVPSLLSGLVGLVELARARGAARA